MGIKFEEWRVPPTTFKPESWYPAAEAAMEIANALVSDREFCAMGAPSIARLSRDWWIISNEGTGEHAEKRRSEDNVACWRRPWIPGNSLITMTKLAE
ncbi:hypothetical protein V5O48_007456 [Marasmius crinis-equi]|uniref:Uncharacterized protein n=1 Tax=Marasmius crinis-equi TaxID=585013 RepID=A0ABR3FGL8_9AGAR